MNKFIATFLIRESHTATGSTFVNSASIPISARQLVFHYEKWDFRARGVAGTCMIRVQCVRA
jgi:hypothetical protein